MATKGVASAYRKRLCELVSAPPNYSKLWIYLDEKPFIWVNDRDDSRAKDGVYLRKNYYYENGFEVTDEVENKPCSVLEMLVALADRIESQLMYDPMKDDRTSVWFWMMIKNLGLDKYDNANFDSGKVDEILDIWMHCKYSSRGVGSLFPRAESPSVDQRKVEIWYQMSAYFSKKFPLKTL